MKTERRKLGYSVEVHNSFWRLRWRDPVTGKQKARSLKIKADRSRKEALIAAAAMMEPIQEAADKRDHYLDEQAVWNNAIAHARRYVAAMGFDPNAARVRVEPHGAASHTVGELVTRYKGKLQAEMDKGERTEKGLKTINGRVDWLITWAGADTPLHNLTPELMDEFHRSIQRQSVTVKNIVAANETMFNYAISLDWMEGNPMRKIQLRTAPGKKPNLWTAELLDQVIAHAPNPDWKLLPLIAFYQGPRMMDIVRIDWRQIDEEHVLRFTASKTRHSTGIEVVSPLHPKVIAALPPRQSEGPLVPILSACNSGHLSNQFIEMMDAAQINRRPSPNLGNLTFHALRHTFNTRLHNLHCPDSICKALLGHSTKSDIHAGYTQYEVATLRRWIHKL